MGIIFGGFVFILTFYILFNSRVFRRTKWVFLSTWIVLMATHFSTIINEYLTVVKGADGGDHANFYECAETLAAGGHCRFGFNDILYVQIMAKIFRMFGASSFLGSELSVLAFIISCYFLLKIAGILKIRQYDAGIILFFGLLPSGIIIKSLMLRESYQVLFFIMTVYWGLLFHEEASFKNGALCIFSGFLMSLFHYSLGIVAIFTIIVLIFRKSEKEPIKNLSTNKFLRTGIIIALGTMLIINLFFPSIGQRIGAFNTLIRSNPLEYLVEFREYSMQMVGRATYSTENIDTTSWYTITTGISRIVANYFFYPYAWKIKNILDIYGFLETMWRALLMAIALGVIFEKNNSNRKTLQLLFLIYLFNSFLWALGTTNYGTAIRHHLVGYWLLILITTPFLVDYLKIMALGFRRRKLVPLSDHGGNPPDCKPTLST